MANCVYEILGAEGIVMRLPMAPAMARRLPHGTARPPRAPLLDADDL